MDTSPSTPVKKYRRKRKLIKSGFQLRLVTVFLAMGCMAAVFQVLMLNRSILAVARRTGVAGAEFVEAVPHLLTINGLYTLGVLIPLMTIVGVLATHRIAGPVYRFEKHLERLARGEKPGPCRIRKGDELQELCQWINRAAERWTSGNDASSREDDASQKDDAARETDSAAA